MIIEFDPQYYFAYTLKGSRKASKHKRVLFSLLSLPKNCHVSIIDFTEKGFKLCEKLMYELFTARFLHTALISSNRNSEIDTELMEQSIH